MKGCVGELQFRIIQTYRFRMILHNDGGVYLLAIARCSFPTFKRAGTHLSSGLVGLWMVGAARAVCGGGDSEVAGHGKQGTVAVSY